MQILQAIFPSKAQLSSLAWHILIVGTLPILNHKLSPMISNEFPFHAYLLTI